MSPSRVFTDDVVLAIVRLHSEGRSLDYLVDRFGHEPQIRSILAGKGYRGVIHNRGAGPCEAPCCVVPQRQERNFDRARATKFVAHCVHCGVGVEQSVWAALSTHGQASCVRCGGRKQ